MGAGGLSFLSSIRRQKADGFHEFPFEGLATKHLCFLAIVASRRPRSRLFSFDPESHASRAVRMSRISMVRSSRAVRLIMWSVVGGNRRTG
jgi:hypothetical protein